MRQGWGSRAARVVEGCNRLWRAAVARTERVLGVPESVKMGWFFGARFGLGVGGVGVVWFRCLWAPPLTGLCFVRGVGRCCVGGGFGARAQRRGGFGVRERAGQPAAALAHPLDALQLPRGRGFARCVGLVGARVRGAERLVRAAAERGAEGREPRGRDARDAGQGGGVLHRLRRALPGAGAVPDALPRRVCHERRRPKHASIRRVRPIPDLSVFDVFRDEAPTSDTSQNTPRFNALAPSETPPRTSSFDTGVRRETRAKTCPVSTLSTRLKPLCFDLFRREAPARVVAQNMPRFSGG